MTKFLKPSVKPIVGHDFLCRDKETIVHIFDEYNKKEYPLCVYRFQGRYASGMPTSYTDNGQWGEEGNDPLDLIKDLGPHNPKLFFPKIKTKNKKKLKLYVWEDFYSDYTSGLAFAIAKNEEEARKIIESQFGYELSASNWGKLSVLPLYKKCGFCVTGGG